MVRLFSVYHFTSQMVDTVEDQFTMTVTNHNKLLIAQADYTIEVRDLQSEDKKPLFSFPTVDKVHSIVHCASGNYVVTLEGKQASSHKSEILVARVYTNWEADFVLNEYRKSNKYPKRFMRARISGVVTPSSVQADEDYLDMIEIPVSYSTGTLITCCQKTGRLLVASDQTVYIFRKVYLRGHNGKSPLFMDFVPLAQFFHLTFSPVSVTICEDFVSAHSDTMVVVFALKEATQNSDKKIVKNVEADENADIEDMEEIICEADVKTENGALNLAQIIELVKDNKENRLKGILHSISFPVTVHLKGINDSNPLLLNKRYPFKIIPRKLNLESKNEKIEDNFVETRTSNKEFLVIAQSLLAVRITDPEELVSKVSLQVLPVANTALHSDTDSESGPDRFLVEKQFAGINFLVTTYQEGYLFYMSSDTLSEGLQCIAVFSFTSPVINVTFESCFIHALTHTGIETYNLPTCRFSLFEEDSNLLPSVPSFCILGIQPFMGVLDFVSSEDFITIFTTSSGSEKKVKESLPWTVYSLKLPTVWDVYCEIAEAILLYESQDEDICKYLSIEGYVLLQTAVNLHLPMPENVNASTVKSTLVSLSIRLAKLYFRTKNIDDMKSGASIILASNTDPIEFIKQLQNEEGDFRSGIMYLLEKWISNNTRGPLEEETVEWIIRIFEESNEIVGLAKFLLRNEIACRVAGHRAIQCLKRYVYSSQENSDTRVIFVLCMLYTQQCLQNEASEVLKYIKDRDTKKELFVTVALKYWGFLFEKSASNKEQSDFSEFTSVLVESLPLQLAEILTRLVRKRIFSLSDIVQKLLRLFPCQVSIEKGHLVLQTFLESVFSNKIISNTDDPNVKNCLKILLRSYLTQLRVKDEQQPNETWYQPVFSEKLPEFVNKLPVVENCNYTVLRKIQGLTWSRVLSEDIVKEIVETLPNTQLKLNVLAMLSSSDFVRDLVTNDCLELVFPYAECNFSGVKKWKEFVNFIHSQIVQLKESGRNCTKFEEILTQTLEHLAEIMNPTQLSVVFESSIPKESEVYWKYIMKSQQISYAKDIKELVINTSQQLLQSNTFY